ncbi:hypothetical protein BS78_09G194200 [Paspalum vaginatum]|nr:hypothetical protein BS78_09G194200 [Paspalum vaginatum]
MASRLGSLLLILFAVGVQVQLVLVAGAGWQEFLQLPTESAADGGGVVVGTKWALLIAGSRYYYNYRHQADVCHAYQVMKKGGLRDENIVVFMYDDIAYSGENPWPGVIINQPNGTNVYAGVPKDYTGADVNVNNVLAALRGDASAIIGGSGKVISSGPYDHVFVYYSDHGGYGVLGMPDDELLFAYDLVETLKRKHAARGYSSLTFYVEACESGSIFEGLLPTDIGVYAVTAANATESSWATYWDPELGTFLGDLFSVAWMEETDSRDRCAETLEQQYELVRDRTSVNGTYVFGSHVMQYGDMGISNEQVCQFMGRDPVVSRSRAVKQRDAELVCLWHRYRRSAEGTPQKAEARARLQQVMSRRSQVDSSVELIGGLLFGGEGPAGRVLGAVRGAGQPLVDDWDCLKSVVRAYERHCGPLERYGMKHMRAFANICNAGVGDEAVAKAATQACAASRSESF